MEKHATSTFVRLMLFVVAGFITGNSNAQWVCNGPYGGYVTCMAANGSNIFAGTEYNGIYHSPDNGANWASANNGFSGYGSNGIQTLVNKGSEVFAGTAASGVFLTTDNGANWTHVSTGLPNDSGYGGVQYDAVSSMAVSDNNLVVGNTERGIFFSADDGAHWIQKNNGLTDTFVTAVASNGATIFAGTQGGKIFSSADNGDSWTQIDTVAHQKIASITAVGSVICAGAGSYGPILLSKDNGVTWTQQFENNFAPPCEAIVGSKIYIGGDGNGVMVSADTGKTWVAIDSGLTFEHIYAFTANSAGVFAGTNSGVYLLNTTTNIWSSVNNGFTGVAITGFAASGATVFTSSSLGGIYSSTGGSNWSLVSSPQIGFNAMATSGSTMFATSPTYVYRSVDNGNTWPQVPSGISSTAGITCVTANGQDVYVGSFNGMFVSNDNGLTWATKTSHYPTHFYGELFDQTFTFATKGNNVFMGVNDYGDYDSSSLYISADKGDTWAKCDSSLEKFDVIPNVLSLAVSGQNIYAGTADNGVFLSTDNGAHWVQKANGMSASSSIYALAASGPTIIAGSDNAVYVSNNNGDSWTNESTGMPAVTKVNELSIVNGTVYAGTGYSSVWQRPLSELVPCSASFSLQPDPNIPHLWYALNGATGQGPISYSWSWGDGSNADTGQLSSHTYNAPGYYGICLSITDSAGCMSTFCDSSTYVFKTDNSMVTIDVVNELPTTTGIASVENTAPTVSVYPNPANSSFVVETNVTDTQQLQLFDITGQLVLERAIENKKTLIPINSLPAGVYSVSIKSDGGMMMKKLVVAR